MINDPSNPLLNESRGRDAPRSVTVAASSCTEAGLVATLALLHGPKAEAFLDEQGARYWMID